jgi:hypothetical protein
MKSVVPRAVEKFLRILEAMFLQKPCYMLHIFISEHEFLIFSSRIATANAKFTILYYLFKGTFCSEITDLL